MESNPSDKEVNPFEQIIIKKSTMITTNAKPISNVYKMNKKTIGSGTFGVVRKLKHIETG